MCFYSVRAPVKNWPCFECRFCHPERLLTDSQGNTLSEKVLHHRSKNNLIIGNKKLIATIDVENLVVVDTPHALLLCKRGETQRIKELVKLMPSNS